MEHEPSQKAVQHIVYGDVDKDDDSLSDEYFEIVEEQEPTEEPKKQEPEQVLYAPDNRDEEGRAHRAAAKSGAKAIGMKAELGDRWSKGSELHHIGECKPCIWIWKPSGCSHGTECEFCHSCDQHELAKRRAEKDAKLRSEFRRKRALMAAARERYERECYERWASSGHPMVPPGTPGYYPPYGGPTPYGGAAPGGHEAYGGAPPYGGPGQAPPGAWMQGGMPGGMPGGMRGGYVDPYSGRAPDYPQVPYGGRHDEAHGGPQPRGMSDEAHGNAHGRDGGKVAYRGRYDEAYGSDGGQVPRGGCWNFIHRFS